jgi:hypothetical protein
MKFEYTIRAGGMETIARNGIELDSYVRELLDRGFTLDEITITVKPR